MNQNILFLLGNDWYIAYITAKLMLCHIELQKLHGNLHGGCGIEWSALVVIVFLHYLFSVLFGNHFCRLGADSLFRSIFESIFDNMLKLSNEQICLLRTANITNL